jgi:serine/threonine protein kinase/signal transduction histidine kinase
VTDVQSLKGLPGFEGVSDEEAARIVARTRVRRFAVGERILRRGDQGNEMYAIISGRVQVPVLDESGQLRLTKHLGPGDVFGEIAVLTDLPRSADVVVEGTEDCHCRIFDRDSVFELIGEHRPVARFLTQLLGERLLESHQMRKVGKYRLLGRVGQGGMATIFEGHHLTLDRRVAIKMLPHELIYERDFVDRFRTEAQLIAGLTHPGIVQVYDTEEAYATYFIVMELLAGQDLAHILRASEPMPIPNVRSILRQVASALRYAHDHGVFHRDIKPSNIFIETGGRARILDFGLAGRHLSGAGGSGRGGFVGTPAYAPPEAVRERDIDARSDIYSLGVTAYQMLTGRLPFDDSNPTRSMKRHLTEPLPDPRQWREDIPDDLLTFIRRATRKNPQDRFRSCSAVLALLVPAPDSGADHALPGELLRVFHDARYKEAVAEILGDARERLRALSDRGEVLTELASMPSAQPTVGKPDPTEWPASPPPDRSSPRRAAQDSERWGSQEFLSKDGSAVELSDILSVVQSVSTFQGSREATPDGRDRRSDHFAKKLRAAFDAVQALIGITDADALCARILDTAFGLTHAESGCVLLLGAGAHLESRAERTPDGEGKLMVSRTIVADALERGEAILAHDAVADSRWSSAASIQASEERSVICVPLVHGPVVHGVLYLSNSLESAVFGEEELTLLTGIGAGAGVALSNARLLRESMQQERLASIGLAVSSIAHHLKNIVYSARIPLSLMRRGVDHGDATLTTKALPILERSSVRMETTVTEMLAFAKERRPVMTTGSLNDLVRDAADLMQARAEDAEIALMVELEPDLDPIPLDREGLHQVLMNLIGNAIEAHVSSPDSAWIRLRTEARTEDRRQVIEIADNGPGISAEFAGSIFEPFFSTKGAKGTGLGLSIVRKLVNEMGGTIEVVSAPGQGATFQVELLMISAADEAP